MKMDVAKVAAASGVLETSLRNWLQKSEFSFGSKTVTGRWRFNVEDAKGIALAGALVDGGIAPRMALRHAATLLHRARGLPLFAVAATDPKVAPCLVPLDAVPKLEGRPLVLVDLGALSTTVEGRLPQ